MAQDDILKLYGSDPKAEFTMAEIIKLTGLSKGSAYANLASLKAGGFVSTIEKTDLISLRSRQVIKLNI